MPGMVPAPRAAELVAFRVLAPADELTYNPPSLGVSRELRCKWRTLSVDTDFPFTHPKAMGAVEKDVILTPDGYEKLKQQIEDLETNKRREVADRIREAREFGDISENSEYDDAKNEQALLEHRIARLKEQLRAARVIDPKDVPKDVVSVGTRVKVKDVDHGDVDTYEIVGSAEADPANSRLSNESPVGRALLGHKKGETVEVAAPRGSLKFKIMDIKAA
jgi:transcription elongation factor GreA